jgi:transmembrane sensor
MSSKTRLQSLLVKYLKNSCSESEMEELFRMIKNAEHEPVFKKILSDYWHELPKGSLSDHSEIGQEPDKWFEEIKTEARSREKKLTEIREINFNQPSRPQSVSGTATAIFLKSAAVLMLSVFIYLFYQSAAVEETVQEIVYEQKFSEPGEKVRFQLPDGTQVHLNSDSHLTFPATFGSDSREVRLEGEAFFSVVRDESRPFLVHTEKITTRVLGTSFNKQSYAGDDQVSVAVVSGSVELTNQNHGDLNTAVVVSDNGWVRYSIQEESFDKGRSGIESLTAWNENVLLFYDKKLKEVARDLERWYGVQIIFDNKDLMECLIRGEHRNETLVNVLDAIAYAFEMDYKIEGNKVMLFGTGCRVP